MRPITLIFVLLSVSIYSCSTSPSPLKTGQEGKALPSFDFLLLDSTTHVNTASVPKGEPFIIFLFSPYCPYCRAETEQILANMNDYKKIRFYFLCSFPFDIMRKYYKHYKFSNYPNIVYGQDYGSFFGDYYKANAIPYMAIFDKNKCLKKVYIGNVGTQVIKDINLE